MFLIFSVFFQLLFISLSLCKPLEDSSLGLNEVAYHNEPSHIYLGSPSIVRLSSGRLLASHDFFGPGAKSEPQNVSVYSSDDNGVTWSFLSYILHTFFTTLTVYNDRVYAIGIRGGNNQSGIVIHRSTNNGVSWNYNDSGDGVILFHGLFDSGAMPIVIANQVMYRTIEYHVGTRPWPFQFQAALISCNLSSFSFNNDVAAAAHDPIMSPNNWKITPPVPFDNKWLPSTFPNLTAPGFLEGNIVILPKSSSSENQELRVLNVLRFNSIPLANLALILELNQTSNTLSFVSIINFPGGMSKFTIRFDPVSQTYITLCNPVTVESVPQQRNILSLSYTKDLEKLSEWHIAADRLLYDDTGFTVNDSLRYTGFHYVDWQFDTLSSVNKASCIEWNCDGGPDMIYLVRTSYRGANTYHNSNRITYKTLSNYRELIKHDQAKRQTNNFSE